MYRRRNEFEMMNQTSCRATSSNDFESTFSPENFIFSTFQVILIFWREIKSILRYIVEWFNKDLPPAILQPFKIWYVELQGGYP